MTLQGTCSSLHYSLLSFTWVYWVLPLDYWVLPYRLLRLLNCTIFYWVFTIVYWVCNLLVYTAEVYRPSWRNLWSSASTSPAYHVLPGTSQESLWGSSGSTSRAPCHSPSPRSTAELLVLPSLHSEQKSKVTILNISYYFCTIRIFKGIIAQRRIQHLSLMPLIASTSGLCSPRKDYT